MDSTTALLIAIPVLEQELDVANAEVLEGLAGAGRLDPMVLDNPFGMLDLTARGTGPHPEEVPRVAHCVADQEGAGSDQCQHLVVPQESPE